MSAFVSGSLGTLWRLLYARDGELTRELERVQPGLGLGQVPKDLAPEATVTTVCGFCATGCGLQAHLRDGRAVALTPDPDYPVNLGMACPKGWEALAALDAPNRATTPLLKGTDGIQRPVDWPRAMTEFVARVRALGQRHGPDTMAFLSTGQIVSEEMAYLGALAKFAMGMRHGDGNTRQCMATAVTAYKQSFGFDAPPYSYADLEESDLIVLVGSNMCIAHPILWERVLRNRRGARVVVVDPRRTETAMAAHSHLQLRPKSDLPLFYALAHVLIERGWIDEDYVAAHTRGFEDFARHVAAFAPSTVAEATGIAPAEIHDLAEAIHRAKRVSWWWTMGVNQSHEGTRVAQSLINLALMTGNLGRPGTGANSITGQCNAMGSRLFSNTTNLLGGHDFADPVHRRKVAGVLGIDPVCIPDDAGYSYERILDGVDRGEIRGLWIVATNTAHSWIGRRDVDRVLAKLDLLVVQDMYADTDTALRADIVLPAAGWGEKQGTFISSDRRITLTHKLRHAPGQALSDLAIFQLVAHYWGAADMFERWQEPEDIFGLLQLLTRDMPCDIGGIEGYRMLAERGGVQWPYPARGADQRNERCLFADGVFAHPDGRARFLFSDPEPRPDPVRTEFPLTLLTGRGSAAQWHTQTRTGCSDILSGLAPRELYVQIHPEDAAARGIADDEYAEVTSAWGTIRARTQVTASVGRGQVFAPMHELATNRLTVPAFDRYSRQPSYKATAVEVRKAD